MIFKIPSDPNYSMNLQNCLSIYPCVMCTDELCLLKWNTETYTQTFMAKAEVNPIKIRIHLAAKMGC